MNAALELVEWQLENINRIKTIDEPLDYNYETERSIKIQQLLKK